MHYRSLTHTHTHTLFNFHQQFFDFLLWKNPPLFFLFQRNKESKELRCDVISLHPNAQGDDGPKKSWGFVEDTSGGGGAAGPKFGRRQGGAAPSATTPTASDMTET